MMRANLSSLALLMLCACTALATPLQLRWTAELSDPKPYQAVLFAGESADLVATLKLYGRPVALETNATASLYWQTNGMGSAWWQSPATVTTAGVVTASWTPAMDAGADLYRWHIGVANAASSTIYRAFGAFRMQPSPGAVPNEIPIPPRVIDFGSVTVLNPPWATPADLASAGVSIIEDILSETNALLVVANEVATIETNGVPIWSSASGAVPPSVTNELWHAIAELQSAVASLSRAWGDYAPDGSPNPDPAHMLWINRPATVWGAGFQWAVSGGHAVLTATGTVAFAAGGSGEMRIGPGDGTNYFGFVTGGSVEVGASASGITVADDVATIIYPYETGDFPTLWFTPDLATPFEIMSGVVWVDNSDGTATVTAPATTARGFWRATTSSTFASEFKSTMPARFTGGVWGATNDFPVKYDSTITIQSGGKNYRIVAEEVH